MKVLKTIGLVLGIVALCAAFGMVGSFLSQPSVHAATNSVAPAKSAVMSPTRAQAVAAQTAQEADGLPQ